jgi:hypothetical protein
VSSKVLPVGVAAKVASGELLVARGRGAVARLELMVARGCLLAFVMENIFLSLVSVTLGV